MRGITLENTEIKFLNIQNAEFFSTMTIVFLRNQEQKGTNNGQKTNM